jgi:inhibitor of KinA sporulation pathway (predicted exonuclease)
MIKLIDKIVVVDIECTCWEDSVPTGQQSEIIEVGVCLLDIQTGAISDSKGIIVKPSVSDVSPFCTQLTSITPEMVSHGISFKDACDQLKEEYLTTRRSWASYGYYDQVMFIKQCERTGVPYPFSSSYLNIKTLLPLRLKLKRELGMKKALDKLGIPLEGTHHRGVDDAKNIAKILRSIFAT